MQELAETKDTASPGSGTLVVTEADDLVRATLVDQLRAEGFAGVFAAGDETEVGGLLERHGADLLVIDSAIGKGRERGGIELCRRLRGEGFDRPIIMLVGEKGERDVIASLEAGANDYLIKPVRLRMLVDQIRQQLRQYEARSAKRAVFGGLVFVPGAKLLQTHDEQRRVILTEKETMVLQYLHGRAPKRVPREELLEKVWGVQAGLTTHTVETHIYRLRQKMRRLTPVHVITSAKQGYALDMEG